MQILDEENEEKDRGVPVIRDGIPKQKSLLPLPAFYADVPPLVLKQQEPYVTTVEGCTLDGVTTLTAASDLLAASREKEHGWLQHVCSKLNNEQLGENDYLRWASYHASRQVPELRKVYYIILLPLFKEHVSTPAMICHSMKVLKRTTEYLNPGRTPVLTVDQPLYALAKKI